MKRNRSLDVLRGVAMVAIVVSHCYSILSINNTYILSLFSDLGRWGILCFLLVSGFFLERDKNHASLIKATLNVIKKIRKFYFLHIITMCIMILIYCWESRMEQLGLKIVSNIFLLQSFVPVGGTEIAYSLNTPVWYLSMMIFCWLLVPFMQNICCKIKWEILSIITYVLIGVILLLIYNFLQNSDVNVLRYYMYVNPIINCGFLFFGMISIRMLGKRLDQTRLSWMCWAVLTLFIYLNKDLFPVDWRVYWMLLPTSILIASLSTHILLKENVLIKGLALIGQNSIIVLLIHWPICYILRQRYRGQGVVCFLLTLLSVCVCFYIVLGIRNIRKSR